MYLHRIDTTYMKSSLSVKKRYALYRNYGAVPGLLISTHNGWFHLTVSCITLLLASLYKSGRRGVIRNWLTYTVQHGRHCCLKKKRYSLKCIVCEICHETACQPEMIILYHMSVKLRCKCKILMQMNQNLLQNWLTPKATLGRQS